MDFTTEKINANFSNYSAWHYRSKLLPQIYESGPDGGGGGGLLLILCEELELLRNAFYTAPEGQRSRCSCPSSQRW